MSLIERYAVGALDAEEATLEDGLPLARDLVRASPLAAWFPVQWTVVDHNLPCDRYEKAELVVVTSDEEEEPSVPLRFVVTRVGMEPAVKWTVWIAGPGQSGPDWLDGAQPVERASDVGRWIKRHRPAA